MAGILAVGAHAPNFYLPTDGNGTVSLSSFAGRKFVLYFYPKADTPGCTQEAMDFTRLRPRFDRADAAILGVSADPVRAQDRFKAKYDIAFPLASDPTHEMLAAYGAWGEKSLYGRKFMGVLRTTYLIGADGLVAKVWPKVRVPGHAEEVLAAAEAL